MDKLTKLASASRELLLENERLKQLLEKNNT